MQDYSCRFLWFKYKICGDVVWMVKLMVCMSFSTMLRCLEKAVNDFMFYKTFLNPIILPTNQELWSSTAFLIQDIQRIIVLEMITVFLSFSKIFLLIPILSFHKIKFQTKKISSYEKYLNKLYSNLCDP